MRALKILFHLLLISLSGLVSAQETVSLSGKVVDKENSEPLNGASVTLKGSSISTIANAEGAFTFYIPALYKNDTLRISVIGYKSFEAPLSAMNFEKLLVIKLDGSPISLEPVTITETLTPEDILKLALEKIPANYFSKPFVQNSFYREVQHANGRYVSLIEAALQMHNLNYQIRGQKIKVLQLRRSKPYKHATHSFWETYNVLHAARGLNTVGYLSRKSLKEYTLKREVNTTLNGKPVFVLTSETPALWPIKFYIQCDNFAIVRVEEMYDASRDGIKSWTQQNSDTIIVFPQARRLVVEYRSFQGKYALSLLSFSVRMIYKGAQSGRELVEFTIFQDLMVNEIQSDGVKPLRNMEALKENMKLEDQPFAYDADFWKNYNMIQRTPLQDSIRKDLERESTLEEQFQSHIVKPQRPEK